MLGGDRRAGLAKDRELNSCRVDIFNIHTYSPKCFGPPNVQHVVTALYYSIQIVKEMWCYYENNVIMDTVLITPVALALI